MAKYTVRVTTYYPSFVVEADSEQAALELAYATPWPNDAQSFFEIEEDDRDHCQGCDTILRQDESETLCKSCEELSNDTNE